jgi:hypothetical protein
VLPHKERGNGNMSCEDFCATDSFISISVSHFMQDRKMDPLQEVESMTTPFQEGTIFTFKLDEKAEKNSEILSIMTLQQSRTWKVL